MAPAHAESAAAIEKAPPDNAPPGKTPPGKDAAQAAVATAARLDDDGERATLVLTHDGALAPSAFVLADPPRVIVDAPGLRFAIEPDVGRAPARPSRGGPRHAKAPPGLVRPGGLVASFRFGQLDRSRARIVIDLSGPAKLLRVASEKGEDGESRLTIELARAEKARFLAAAESARLALMNAASRRGTDEAAPVPAGSGKPVVMIDPGHGGIDRGASVNGLVEKDLVLAFATALAEKIAAEGRFEPVLTRSDDSFIALGERVRMARERGAALFVSIHADSVAEAAQVSGATIYTVSERASDAAAARLAEQENQADALAGVASAPEAGDVSDILFELARRETRAYSHVFARTLMNYWKLAGGLNKNPLRSAGFRVLMAPDVPSILLELGYLSNPGDDAALSSPQWRDAAIARVSEAVSTFFAEREGADVAHAGAAPAAQEAGGTRP
ncbi:N-acetylmuramoyl-L-alanine amidase [Methylocella sp.]|uniref:N-acetylmuramoyl-L-alanine amidase n=1 Tax=Methylocella sp. TaxID=1978226 RepID=UPI0037830B4E